MRREAVTCELCRAACSRLVWSDPSLCDTPTIYECRNRLCPRKEFRVLQVGERTIHCGVPGQFKPRRLIYSAIQQAHRQRAMERLPASLDALIRQGRLRGVRYGR